MAVVGKVYVEPKNGDPKYLVEADMGTIFEWETTYRGRSLTDLTAKGGWSAHDMFEIAYVWAKLNSKTVPDKLVDFVRQNEVTSAAYQDALEAQQTGTELTQEDVAEPDPTQQAPSTGA